MSNRLDKDREERLQPKRVAFVFQELKELGFNPEMRGETTIAFMYKNAEILFYPYSGWHSGSTIRDGRGWKKLKLQIT